MLKLLFILIICMIIVHSYINTKWIKFNKPAYDVDTRPPLIFTMGGGASRKETGEDKELKNCKKCIQEADIVDWMKKNQLTKIITLSDFIEGKMRKRDLFIANWLGATNIAKLKKHKIKHIVCLNKKHKTEKEMKTYKKLDITHLHIDIDDMPTENICKYFNEIEKILDKYSGHILVHCTAGISRSATIVIMYIARKMQWSIHKAISYVKSKRSCVNPNEGFIKQLML